MTTENVLSSRISKDVSERTTIVSVSHLNSSTTVIIVSVSTLEVKTVCLEYKPELDDSLPLKATNTSKSLSNQKNLF